MRVDACFFHCAKAFKRSQLWQPATWPAKLRISFGMMMAPKLGGAADMAAAIDRMIEEDYENR